MNLLSLSIKQAMHTKKQINNIKFTIVGALFLAPMLCFAQPSAEQLKQIVLQKSVPSWIRAIETSKQIKANPPVKSWPELWDNLDATEKTSSTQALTKASNATNGQDMYGYATWLRHKILADNADGRYSYAYAYDLMHMKDGKGSLLNEAATFLANARLAIAIDGARCRDSAGAEHLRLKYETQESLRPLVLMVEKMSARDKAVAMLEAAGIEEARGERPPMEAMCNIGARAIARALNQGQEPRKVDTDPAEKNPTMGDTYEVDTTKIKAELVPITEWRKARREILDKTISDAAKLL